MKARYLLGAYWPARRESIDECADRLLTFFTELTECDPAFAAWYSRGRSRTEASRRRIDVTDINTLLKLLHQGRSRGDVGGDVIEHLGFGIGLWNGAGNGKEAALDITCGLYWKSAVPNISLSNCVLINLPRELGDLRHAHQMSRVLAIVARTWQPAWAGVMSTESMNDRDFDAERPFVDWMVFVRRRIVDVSSPSSVLPVEGLGSIVIVQPTPPCGNNHEELLRIRRISDVVRDSATN
jgi:hypothetical protein